MSTGRLYSSISMPGPFSRLHVPLLAAAAVIVFAGGCATGIGENERTARERLAAMAKQYRPEGERPALPDLRPDSPEREFVRYAILNHPAVEAAFHEWRAAVAAVPVARAQPDPTLTFEADIAEKLMSFMPGVMFDFMNRGTRVAMVEEALAEGDVAHRRYLAEIERVVLEVRRAWIELAYADEALDLHGAMLRAFDEAAETAAADYITDRAMPSLETQVRLRNTAGMHHTEHHATVALRRAARARFKAALGIPLDAPNPPWPEAKLQATELPGRAELWRQIAAGNPDLAVMRTMVDVAVAQSAVADTARKPNFALGAMVDLKASPLMVRPTGALSLPVWREKIAAQLAAARARHDAAIARVSAEELMLAAELAQMLYMVDEADEMLTYIDETALPNLDVTMATAAAGFETGMGGGATMVAETQAMRLEMLGRRLDSLRVRETAVASIQLLVGGVADDNLQ
jgi:outer membrane protein TolC